MSERRDLDLRLVDDYLSIYPDYNMTLPEAVAWLQGLLDKVPQEHRERSYFQIESESDYEGGYSTTLRIGYRREETDEEMAQREAKEAAEHNAYVAKREAEERAAYEALRRKYG